MATALLAVVSTGEITPGTEPNTVAFDLLVNISGHAQISALSSQYLQSATSYEEALSAYLGGLLQ